MATTPQGCKGIQIISNGVRPYVYLAVVYVGIGGDGTLTELIIQSS
jgi:hypothetical protein